MAYYGGGQGGGPGLNVNGPGNQPQLVRTSTGVTLQPQLFGQLQFGPPSSQHQHQHQGYSVEQNSHLQLLQQHQQQQQQQQSQQSSFQNLQVTSFLSDQLAAAAAGVNQIISQAGGAANLVNSATVAAATAALNFQQQNAAANASSQASSAQKQRVFTGTVTKIHDNFGFIDDECFFNTSVVRGPIKCMQGDRVLVEAEYNPSTPFKWNATRVQIVNMGGNIPHSLNSTTKSQSPSVQTYSTVVSQASSQTMDKLSSQRPQTHLVAPPAPILSMQQGGSTGDPRTRSGSNNGPNYGNVGIPSHSGYGQQANQSPVANSMRPVQRPGGGRGVANQVVMPVPVPEPLMTGQSPYAAHAQVSAAYQSNTNDMGIRMGRDTDRNNHDRVMANKDNDRRGRSRSRSRGRGKPRDRSRERDRQRSRSRERRDRERSKERARRRSPSPKTIRNDRSGRNERESKERNRSRERNATRDAAKDRQIAPSPVPSTASSSTRKRSKSRERDGDRPTRRTSPERGSGHSSRRTRSRSPSPKRRMTSPRYNIVLPNFSLDIMDFSVLDLRKRYPRLYIPSELFMAKACWVETFPVHKPFQLTKASPIHVFRKHSEQIELGQIEYNVETNTPNVKVVQAVQDPDDTRKVFQAKVLLLSLPGKTALYENAGCTGECNGEDAVSKHLTKLLNFVCGVKLGKTELMAIGGPHSPSLDGLNPQSDPQVLINTAIRNCKSLTGIDLTKVNRWFRFMEMYYRRANGILETVVIFIPDLSTCVPTTEDWSRINQAYDFAIYGKDPIKEEAEKIESKQDTAAPAPKQGEVKSTGDSSPMPVLLAMESDGIEQRDGSADDKDSVGEGGTQPPLLEGQEVEEKHSEVQTVMEVDDKKAQADGITEAGPPELNLLETSGDAMDISGTTEPGTPVVETKPPVLVTHQLDVNSMTVNKLKEELSRRGLPVKGLKNQLIQRLNEALEAEKIESEKITLEAQEKPQETQVEVQPEVEMKQDESSKSTVDMEQKRREFFKSVSDIVVPVLPDTMDEKSRKQWERRYALPKRPHVIAHPSGNGKTSDFDCAKMTLASLREYKAHDFKEKSFEVSLFSEFFYEMLQRDFAFKIYVESVKRTNAPPPSQVPATPDPSTNDEKEVKKEDVKVKVEKESESTPTLNDQGKDNGTVSTSSESKEGKDDKKAPKETKQTAVVPISRRTNSSLLLAFTFFDTNRCGYIKENEFEELCLLTGIGLTRSRIRKLMQKLQFDKSSTFYYNIWTEVIGSKSDKDEEASDELDEEFVKSAGGNKSVLPIFLPTTIGKTFVDSVEEETVDESLMVSVNGTQVNVKQLLAQIEKYEIGKKNMEANLNAVTNSMNDTRAQFNEVKKSNENIKTENLKLKDSLKNLESLTKSQGDELEVFRKASERFYDRVKEYINKASSAGGTGSANTNKKDD